MTATQARRASLYTALEQAMGTEAADTLVDELPPGGWADMATKADLGALEDRVGASFATALARLDIKLTEGFAQAAAERAEIVRHQAETLARLEIKLTEGLAQAAAERAEIVRHQAETLAGLEIKLTEGLAQAAAERAEIVRYQAETLARLDIKLTEGLAQAATERAGLVKGHAELIKGHAELVKSQARQMYVIVSAIAAATVSIWFGLLTTGAG